MLEWDTERKWMILCQQKSKAQSDEVFNQPHVVFNMHLENRPNYNLAKFRTRHNIS